MTRGRQRLYPSFIPPVLASTCTPALPQPLARGGGAPHPCVGVTIVEHARVPGASLRRGSLIHQPCLLCLIFKQHLQHIFAGYTGSFQSRFQHPRWRDAGAALEDALPGAHRTVSAYRCNCDNSACYFFLLVLGKNAQSESFPRRGLPAFCSCWAQCASGFDHMQRQLQQQGVGPPWPRPSQRPTTGSRVWAPIHPAATLPDPSRHLGPLRGREHPAAKPSDSTPGGVRRAGCSGDRRVFRQPAPAGIHRCLCPCLGQHHCRDVPCGAAVACGRCAWGTGRRGKEGCRGLLQDFACVSAVVRMHAPKGSPTSSHLCDHLSRTRTCCALQAN